MQPGLNIGIGSWIDAQYSGADTWPTLPPAAIPFELRHLSVLEAAQDLTRVAELALLANRQSGSSGVNGTDDVPNYLWEVHQENIHNMITAVSVLTRAQREELARANEILYKGDGLTISDRYALYNETRRIYEDLVVQSASAAEVQLAYTNWVTLGHKALIEEAIATKLMLTRTISRLAAANDMANIEHALMATGGDVPYAPTLFTPISAVSPEYWTEAEVDFQALEDAIKPQISRTSWQQFRANKTGRVHFRFVSVDLIRPWFTVSVYEADDWRLASGPDAVVATGNGEAGTLPSYHSRLYMAQILDIRQVTASPTSPILPRPNLPVVPLGPPSSNLPDPLGPPPSQPTLTRPSSNAIGAAAAKAESGGAVSLPVRPVIDTHRLSTIEATPHLTVGTVGRTATIQKLDIMSATNRIEFVQAQVAASASSEVSTPSMDGTSYLVGFGRTNLPKCPNPNPKYKWP